MKRQIAKYHRKLTTDGSARGERIAFLGKDDILISQGPADLVALGEAVLANLNAVALIVAEPSLPITDILVQRAIQQEVTLEPRDTETRTFLHDIPLVRRAQSADPEHLAILLRRRKGIIVEGLGIVAIGGFTPEQAFIHFCSVFHAAFVKYLLDLLADGFRLPGEREVFAELQRRWLQPIATDDLHFRPAPHPDRATTLAEIARVGRYTVEKQLVDSAFGNISWRDGSTILISQTGAHLDELAGCIDPVPNDNSSTAGVTASSELAAHRRIFETTGARAILHGHPKLAVVLSMLCERQVGCSIADCWRQCPHVRFAGGSPIVAGEIGAGGLAEKVAPVIGAKGRAIVFGHGVFTIGHSGFAEAFAALVDVENWCRQEYCRRLAEVHPASASGSGQRYAVE